MPRNIDKSELSFYMKQIEDTNEPDWTKLETPPVIDLEEIMNGCTDEFDMIKRLCSVK